MQIAALRAVGLVGWFLFSFPFNLEGGVGVGRMAIVGGCRYTQS